MRYLALLMIVWVSGCSDREPKAPVNQMVRTAKIFTVEQASSAVTFELVGRVEPLQTVDMSFQVGGPIENIPVLEGQSVKQGDLIAALEPIAFNLAVREAEAQLKLAREDLKRKQQLLTEKGIAKSVVEDAETILELRQVQVDAAQEALKDSRLFAPFDAYVGRRYLDNHTNVNPHDSVVRLYDVSQLLVVTSVPEVILATAKPEQVLELSADFGFLEGEKFPLTYRENRGDSDPLSQTYEVSFTLQTPAGSNILPGMTARVTAMINNAEVGDTLTQIPTSAVVVDDDNKLSVWVYHSDTSQVERRYIQAGLPTNELVPVTSGLVAGEQIIAAGARQLIEGMRIIPFEDNLDD